MAGLPRMRFDHALLDPDDPFEIDDRNRPHLYSHPPYGEDDLYELWWDGDPLFYPARPELEADWLLVGRISGNVRLCSPLASPKSGEPSKCRPIGLYKASLHLATNYDEDRMKI